jgi:hypothetical protein
MEYSLIIATLSVGVVLLLVQGVMHRLVGGGHETTVSLAGNIAVLIGVTGGILLSLQRLVESQVTSELVVMLLSQFVPLALAFGMSVDRSWRTAFKIAATVTGVCLLMVFSQYSNLLLIQKVEVMSLLVGGLLTGVGYWGWSQERDDRRESVSIQLQLGSLFLAAPITMGLLASRLLEFGTPSWQMFHEWGALAVGLMLLGSGVVCQIRSTTLAGSGVLAAFIISLLTWVRWPEQLQSASVMLMIGGGAFFGVALLMSLYRERLISLPQRIRSGEGVYRVFKWR